jgi:hypothetical protein
MTFFVIGLDKCHTLCYKHADMFTQLFDKKAKRHAKTILSGRSGCSR